MIKSYFVHPESPSLVRQFPNQDVFIFGVAFKSSKLQLELQVTTLALAVSCRTFYFVTCTYLLVVSC